MTNHCPTCGAAVRVEASGTTHYMVPTDAERVRELEALLRQAEEALTFELHGEPYNSRPLIDRIGEALEKEELAQWESRGN